MGTITKVHIDNDVIIIIMLHRERTCFFLLGFLQPFLNNINAEIWAWDKAKAWCAIGGCVLPLYDTFTVT